MGTFWDPETKAKANLSLEAVAEHLRRTKKDAHLYCPLCNQGLVKSKGLTQHIHAFHAWALPALRAARDHSLVHRRSLALTSPCWYCAVPFKGHHTQHAAVCAMILHAKLVVLLHHPEVIEDGSGRSFEGRLARSRSGAPASADGGTAGGGLHGPTASHLVLQPQRGQRRQFQPQFPSNRQGTAPPSALSGNLGSEGLVPKLAQLLLRHEDYLNGLAQSTTWVMFQGTAPALSTIPAQATISEQWQITKVEQPASIRHPLRTVLFQTWASELKSRVEALATDQAKRQEAVRLEALTEPDTFHYVEPHPPGTGERIQHSPAHNTGSGSTVGGSHCAQHRGVGPDQLSSDQEATSRNDGADRHLLPGSGPSRPPKPTGSGQ